MIHIPPDFLKLLRLFHSHQVEYLIVGGYAVGYHGYPRATGDIDIWLRRTPDNAKRTVAALIQTGFAAKDLAEEFFVQEHRLTRFGIPPMRVDLMTTLSGVSFDEAFSRRATIEVEGVPLHFIGLDDLRINKQASGRKKDLGDVENLPSA